MSHSKMIRTEDQLSHLLQGTGVFPLPALSLPLTSLGAQTSARTPGLLRVPGLHKVGCGAQEEKYTPSVGGSHLHKEERVRAALWGPQGVLVYNIKPSLMLTFLWTKAFTLETPSVFLPIIMITEHVIPFLLFFFFLHLICHQGAVFFAPLAALPLPALAISGKHTQAHMAFTVKHPSKRGKKNKIKKSQVWQMSSGPSRSLLNPFLRLCWTRNQSAGKAKLF